MLKKFIIASILFVSGVVGLTFYDVWFNYNGSFLHYKHRVETFPVPINVSDHRFEDLQGNQHTIADYKGRPVLMLIWATWCGYCAGDMPKIAAFIKEHPNLETVILPIASPDDQLVDIERFLARTKTTNQLDVFMNPARKIFRHIEIQGVPTYLFIDPEGKAVARGYLNWSDESVGKLVF